MFKWLTQFTNLVRSVLALVLVGALGVVGWQGYKLYYQSKFAEQILASKDKDIQDKAAKIGDLNQQVAAQLKQIQDQAKKIQRLEAANRLLKVDHRLAQVRVLDQWTEPKEKQLVTKFSFVEVDETGSPLNEPMVQTIWGDILYVDGLVVKFQDQMVEEGDPLRGTSVFLFRRLFGENQEPRNGYAVDPVGTRPTAYSAGDQMTDFEKDLWGKFWDYATSAEKADQAGVRAAHGAGVYTKLVKGGVYRLTLRASDGLTIVPEKKPNGNGRSESPPASRNPR